MRFLPRLLPLAAALALPACSGDLLTAPDWPGGGGGYRSGTLRVVNEAPVSVHYVYISPCWSGTWGRDRLGASEVIRPWDARDFRVEPDCHDVRVVLAGGDEVEFRDRHVPHDGVRTVVVR